MMNLKVVKSISGKEILIRNESTGHVVVSISPAEAMNVAQVIQILAGSMLEIKSPKKTRKSHEG